MIVNGLFQGVLRVVLRVSDEDQRVCTVEFVGLSLYIVISILTRLHISRGGLIKSDITAVRCPIEAVGCHRGWRTVAPSDDLYMITNSLHISRCTITYVVVLNCIYSKSQYYRAVGCITINRLLVQYCWIATSVPLLLVVLVATNSIAHEYHNGRLQYRCLIMKSTLYSTLLDSIVHQTKICAGFASLSTIGTKNF